MDKGEKSPKKRTFTRISHLKCTYCGKDFTSLRSNSRYCCRTCAVYACKEGKVSYTLKKGGKKAINKEKKANIIPEVQTIKTKKVPEHHPDYKIILSQIEKLKGIIKITKKEIKKNPNINNNTAVKLDMQEKKLIELNIEGKTFNPKIIYVEREIKSKK